MIEQRLEQRVAFAFRHVLDSHGHQPIDVDRLASGLLMCPEHRVYRLVRGSYSLVASDGSAVIIVMARAAPRKLALDRRIEGLIGGTAAGEQRISAVARHFERI